MIKLFIWFVFCATFAKADRISVVTKIICSHSNPLFVTIKTCRFDPIQSADVSGNFTIDVILVRPLDKIKVSKDFDLDHIIQ
jgi:hypothetical protein